MKRRPEASIMHADLDSFYASVEQRDRPRLRGRPVIVGGGVVLAASYEAKAFGVRSAMGYRAWRELCPHAIVVEPRMSAYTEASRAVFEVFEDTTPFVEGISVDEAFLDVGGLGRVSGTPLEIGAQLRDAVRERVGLPITVGIATTKYLAKVASRAAKPDGLLRVDPAHELEFLHPLPVDALWGVGPKRSALLHARGIRTVGDVAALDESVLTSILGPAGGRHVHALAHNVDPRHVQVGRRRRSIGAQCALGWRAKTDEKVDKTLLGLVERVARRMRKADRRGSTVTLRLRFDDSSRATRSHTLRYRTSDTHTILEAARDLLAAARPVIDERGITLIGITISNLDDDGAIQLELPFDRRSRSLLDVALDDVRSRFGSTSVTRAVLLGKDPELTVPMLPD